MRRLIGYAMATAILASGFTASALAQAASTPSESATPTPDNAIMLTIFLKHDETRPLAELNAQLEKQGFYKAFPPPGVEVGELEHRDGHWSGGHTTPSGLPLARGQPYLRDHSLGRLSHRILSDL
jgi:hypothetical protein